MLRFALAASWISGVKAEPEVKVLDVRLGEGASLSRSACRMPARVHVTLQLSEFSGRSLRTPATSAPAFRAKAFEISQGQPWPSQVAGQVLFWAFALASLGRCQYVLAMAEFRLFLVCTFQSSFSGLSPAGSSMCFGCSPARSRFMVVEFHRSIV